MPFATDNNHDQIDGKNMNFSQMLAFATASLGLCCMSIPASAEVFCTTKSYQVSSYVYGMPALERIVLTDGTTMAEVSLCGTDCTDRAADQRLSVVMTARALGLPIKLYFGDQSKCSDVPAYEKAYAVMLDK
jgi:hypothetical protein